MIKEVHIQNFNNKLKYKQNEYPQCTCKNCFQLFFNSIYVAARQSGKTYCMARIIKHYENNTILDKHNNRYKVRTIIISPTYEQNKVFTALNSIDEENDVYTEYNPEILQSIMDDIDMKHEEAKEYNIYQNVYKKFMKLKQNEVHKLTNSELDLLEKNNYENDMEKPDMFITFIVLDDMLGQNAFSQSKKSKLMNFFIKNRHHGVCFMIAVQSMKGLPREIRLNTNVFFLGKFANSKMICDDCYTEVSNVIDLDKFTNLYNHAIKDKYGALIVDLSNDKKRFLKNLDCELICDE